MSLNPIIYFLLKHKSLFVLPHASKVQGPEESRWQLNFQIEFRVCVFALLCIFFWLHSISTIFLLVLFSSLLYECQTLHLLRTIIQTPAGKANFSP